MHVRHLPNTEPVRGSTLLACLATLALVAACSDDGGKTKPTPDAAVTDATTSEEVAETDTAATDVEETAGTCGEGPSCLNANGQEDLSLCPQPVAEWECVEGCCLKKFVCETNEDCASQLGKPACPDERFTCGCDDETGECVQTMCKLDADCAAGQVCSQGGCRAPLDAAVLQARLLRRVWITAAGASVDPAATLGAQAVDAAGHVSVGAKFNWKLAAGPAFQLDGGKLVATSTAGKSTIEATVEGGSDKGSNPATLWNLGPVPAGQDLRVTAVDDLSLAPLTGKVVVVGLADQATPAAALEADLVGGQASFAGVQFPADIHVLGVDHAPVSILRHPGPGPADVVVPAPLHHFADLVFDGDGKLQKDASTLIHADLVTGTIDYPGSGEAALGVTSLAFGPSLLNFSIEAILGPQVNRPFDDEAPTLVNPKKGEPQEVPGGVTFLLGKPVVTSFVLAGQPGSQTLWTLAGRLALNELMASFGKVFAALEKGLDVGQLVGVLLPYLGGFQSQVVFDVDFAESLTEPLRKLELAPNFPLGHDVSIDTGTLPSTGKDKDGNDTWADLMFGIGGALLPGGEIVPLGLTAGSDKEDSEEVADGLVDPDPETPGQQPLVLSVAPLHSGLQVGQANHVIVTAAVILGGKGKKEGGSIQITPPGVLPDEYAPGPFLPFPLGSSFDPATRTLTATAVADAAFYRATFTGAQGTQWLVVMPGSLAGQPVQVPDLTAWGAANDLGAKPKRVLVGAFDLHQATAYTDLLGPGGLEGLVARVKRTAFIDAAP